MPLHTSPILALPVAERTSWQKCVPVAGWRAFTVVNDEPRKIGVAIDCIFEGDCT